MGKESMCDQNMYKFVMSSVPADGLCKDICSHSKHSVYVQ